MLRRSLLPGVIKLRPLTQAGAKVNQPATMCSNNQQPFWIEDLSKVIDPCPADLLAEVAENGMGVDEIEMIFGKVRRRPGVVPEEMAHRDGFSTILDEHLVQISPDDIPRGDVF